MAVGQRIVPSRPPSQHCQSKLPWGAMPQHRFLRYAHSGICPCMLIPDSRTLRCYQTQQSKCRMHEQDQPKAPGTASRSLQKAAQQPACVTKGLDTCEKNSSTFRRVISANLLRKSTCQRSPEREQTQFLSAKPAAANRFYQPASEPFVRRQGCLPLVIPMKVRDDEKVP